MASLFLAGIALSGCESCSACRDRLWRQDRTTPQVTSTNPSTSPAWGGQARTTGANPFDSNARMTTTGSQTPGTYDSNPGLRPASSLSGSQPTNLGSSSTGTPSLSTQPATNLDRGTQPATRIPDDLGASPTTGQQTPMPGADTGRPSSSAQPAAPVGSTDQSSRWSTSNSLSSQTPAPQFPSAPSGSDSAMSSKPVPPMVGPAAKDGKYQMVYPSAPTTTSSDVKTLPAVPDSPDQ